jgi:hypothetical protein
MRLRTRRQNVVVWSRSAAPGGGYGTPGFPRLRRPGPIRRFARTGALFTVVGLVRLARSVRPRWRPLLAGVVLTVAGVLLRGSAAGIVLLPGLLLLLTAPFIEARPGPDRARHCELARELAAYSTPAQQWDLEATLDRYPDALTRELRDILASQHATATSNQLPGAGRY